MHSVKVDQDRLSVVVRNLFPSSRVLHNARKQAGTQSTGAGGYLELDLWVPDLNIAFEYQDPHHYLEATWYSYTALDRVKLQDHTKRNEMNTSERTLISVPCWWDGSEASLAATIKAHRPDLLPNHRSHPFSSSSSTSSSSSFSFTSSCTSSSPSSPSSPSSSQLLSAISSTPSTSEHFSTTNTTNHFHFSSPIPANPPNNFFAFAEYAGYIPNVGKLMLASFVPSSLFRPISWWASEKYDGLRACWNSRRLYSRLGRILFVPPTLTAQFPMECLDGELWFGRGKFHEAQQIAELNIQLTRSLTGQTTNNSISNVEDDEEEKKRDEKGKEQEEVKLGDRIAWTDMRFLVFDSPALAYHEHPYEDRYRSLVLCFGMHRDFSIPEIVPNMTCVNKRHALHLTSQVLQAEGEGIVLRQPGSTYVQGRSNDIIKFKAQRDAEGLVVSARNNAEYVVRLPDNHTFTANLQTGVPAPKAGEVVTFTYAAYAKGLPTNAKITHVRHDTDWDSLCSDSSLLHKPNGDSDLRSVNKISQKGLNHPIQRQAYGYWTTNESENIRKFFDSFASSRGKDPSNPQTWYPVTGQQICSVKGGNTVMSIYKHSLKRALMDTYPNIGLIEAKFLTTKKYWEPLSNRKRVLDGIATRLAFDPLVPENWYNVTKEAFILEPGGMAMLKYYGYSRIKAVMDIYPDIGLEASLFKNMMVNHWKHAGNRRKFFDEFAKSRVFDPLNPTNWYSVLPSSVLQEKGGSSVLYYYKGSLSAALMDLYSEIGLRETEFKFTRNGKLRFPKPARRKFFDDIAKSCGFNSLVALNWYSVSADIIRKAKNGTTILKYYRGSVIRALQDLYPELAFSESKFCKVTNRFWRVKSNAKAFFDEFAAERCFDPLVPVNWYHVSRASVLVVKGGSGILKHYDDSLEKALMNVYPNLEWNRE